LELINVWYTLTIIAEDIHEILVFSHHHLVFLTSGLLSGISLGIALVLDRRVAHRATQGLTSLLNGVGLWHK
jgi:hypothetical protein